MKGRVIFMNFNNDDWINVSIKKPKVDECVAVKIKTKDGTECKSQIGKFTGKDWIIFGQKGEVSVKNLSLSVSHWKNIPVGL